MKKIKKITCLVLLAVMIALLATACGGNAEVPPADVKNSNSQYTVICKTEDDDPVQGVSIQLCTEDSCQMVDTGNEGTALFDVKPGEYDIEIQSIPAGYIVKGESEIKTSKDINSYNFTFIKAEDNNVVEDEKAEAVAPSDTNNETYFADMKYLDGLDTEGVKVIMVNYWEPWCPYCIEEMPDLEKLYQKYRDDGLLIVGMHEYTEDADKVLEETGVTYPIVNLTQTSVYTRDGYPQTVFVDTEGNIMPPDGPYEAYENWKNEYGYSGYAGYDDWEKVILEELGK